MVCKYFLPVVVGYMAGSIPFGVIFSRVFKLGNLREIGSGNIGATNVLRTGNKTAAALTLFADALKGFLAVWVVGHYFYYNPYDLYFAGLGAVIGHVWPVWLRFSGGKGVATAFGAYIGWHPLLALILMILWLGTATIFRLSSLAALMALSVAPIISFLFISFGYGEEILAKFSLIIAGLILYTHRTNIKRLINSQENKIDSQ